MLGALREGPLDRRDLEERLGISKPTAHRATKTLIELKLVERTEGTFELTDAGFVVACALEEFETATDAAMRLAPLLAMVGDDLALDVELFADAIVTRPEKGYPYRPVERFMTLVEETDQLRGFDSATVAPTNVERIYQQIADGMETEIIYPSDVVESIIENNPDRGTAALESGNLTLMVHDDVPCGLAIFDERVGIGGYDAETGMLNVFVDTDSPAAIEWAEGVYESYRAEAVPLVGQ